MPVRRPTVLTCALVAMWGLTRLWDLILIHLLPWVPYDVNIYATWAEGLRQGSFPVGDTRWQYPDLSAVILLLPSYIAHNYLIGFIVVALLADAAIMTALIVVWRRRRGWIGGVLLWATAGVWVGPVLLTRLDVFPTLCSVVALVFIARPIVAALLSGLGAGLKVWPVVDLVGLPLRKLPVSLVIFAVSTLSLIGLVRLAIPHGDSFLGAQVGRGLQAESLGVLPYLVGSLMGHPVAFADSNGTLELVSSHGEAIGAGLTIVGLVIIGVLASLRWAGRMSHLLPVDLVAFSVLVLIATGRVFSPQYYVWLGGAIAIALLDPLSRMRVPALLIVLSALAAQYVYPLKTGWNDLATAPVLMQLLRLGLLVAAVVVALVKVVRGARPSPIA